jgi:hypothetical protein
LPCLRLLSTRQAKKKEEVSRHKSRCQVASLVRGRDAPGCFPSSQLKLVA